MPLNHLSYPSYFGPFVRAKGKHVFDSVNTQYLDFGLGSGSQIFGHSSSKINDCSKAMLENGNVFCAPSVSAENFSKSLSAKLNYVLRHHVLCSSGTEATQRAVRFARQFTRRKSIISFYGGWHGINEWTLSSDSGSRMNTSVECLTGIPDDLNQFKIHLQPHDTSNLEKILSKNKDIAAIIIEPVPGSNPNDSSLAFYNEVRELSEKHQILLIADEIISGFRLTPGAVSITANSSPPDMIIFGKILGGGFPFGALSISDRIKSQLFNGETVPLMGGTFSGNPFVSSVANFVVENLDESLLIHLNRAADTYRDNFNACATASQLQVRIRGIGSFNRLVFTSSDYKTRMERDELEWPKEKQNLFRKHCYEHNILIPTNGLIFTCTESSSDDFDLLFEAAKTFNP